MTVVTLALAAGGEGRRCTAFVCVMHGNQQQITSDGES